MVQDHGVQPLYIAWPKWSYQPNWCILVIFNASQATNRWWYIFPHMCNIYNVISQFILIFGDLPMIPFICVITLQGRKTLFCIYFFYFEGPKRSQIELGFRGINISSKETSVALGHHERGLEAQNRGVGHPGRVGVSPTLFWPSAVRFTRFFRQPT
jgi:hypothetical protein